MRPNRRTDEKTSVRHVLAWIYFPLLIPAILVGLTICGALGMKIADHKRRSPAEGFLLGFMLGPLGVIIEAALPDEGTRDGQM
jgi:hypothetical protein